jgi:hypothetical protein
MNEMEKKAYNKGYKKASEDSYRRMLKIIRDLEAAKKGK